MVFHCVFLSRNTLTELYLGCLKMKLKYLILFSLFLFLKNSLPFLKPHCSDEVSVNSSLINLRVLRSWVLDTPFSYLLRTVVVVAVNSFLGLLNKMKSDSRLLHSAVCLYLAIMFEH